jgi:hypothetical protein
MLTREDIQKIPSRDRYIDVFVLLVEHGFAKPTDHSNLLSRSFVYFLEVRALQSWNPLCQKIYDCLIRNSGDNLFRFLKSLPTLSRISTVALLHQEVSSLLDSQGAKELSWWTHKELDVLRSFYIEKLTDDHPLTKMLVQRWLPDLKELYQAEKAIQKIKMDQCKEELMMNRWHPNRVEKHLLMGLDVEDM